MSINPRLCYGVSAEKSCLLFLTQSPQRTFKIQKRRDRRERAALRSLRISLRSLRENQYHALLVLYYFFEENLNRP